MTQLSAIVLAAGKGTRMYSTLSKVLHPLAGQPLLFYPIKALKNAACQNIVVVIGHQAEQVKAHLSEFSTLQFVTQTQQLGSGHAALCAKPLLSSISGDCFIVSGDVPLLSTETLQELLTHHQKNNNQLTLTSFKTPNPKGYGRIVRNSEGHFNKIVEEYDVNEVEAKINEVNAGLYLVKLSCLFEGLEKININPKKNEYYLTDLPQVLASQNFRIGVFLMKDNKELQGVNTKLELSQAEEELQLRIRNKWMLAGVQMQNPNSIYIEENVKLNPDVYLEAQVRLENNTCIESGAHISQGTIIKNSQIKQNVKVKAYCVIEDSILESDCSVGPFAHLRPGSHLGTNSKVGNFVEIKKTQLGEGSKASHLSYLGDAIIGKNVNIGAGTITCNYDGKNKFQTILEDEVFVGSDTQFVAPVKVGKGATIGAGTTVTKEVPEASLAISRTEQKNILGYKKR